MSQKKTIFYRLSQFVSLLLGARIFVLIFFTFALYVSAYFLFNQEESLRKFVFDIKANGIIFCSILSIAAGGIINQFYDREKDRIQRPFRTRLQSFLKQKYFLYSYIFLNAVSLIISWLLSPRIFFFFLVYQFVMWFYSHKISKIAILNNLVYVSLTLYPFFGMLVYYQHFSVKIFWMAIFLFLIMLIIDNLKDLLTMRSDKIFGYNTIPLVFGVKISVYLLIFLLIGNACVSYFIVSTIAQFNYLIIYFSLSVFAMILAIFPMTYFKFKNVFWLLNLLRVWVFVGVIFMLLNGIFEKF